MSTFRKGLLIAATLSAPWVAAAQAAEPLKVVASFSILGDLVHQVGGERVAVGTLVGPDSDAHSFEPTPRVAQQVAAADLVVVNGLGFEGWIDRLVEASGYKGQVVVASKGVAARSADGDEAHQGDSRTHEVENHDRGAFDPHAWQSVANMQVYVRNVADALCAADEAGCPTFTANAKAYAAELEQLDREIKAGFDAIPVEGRKIITSHDAFGYFAHAYGITVLAPQGVSTESEASAADVAKLIQQIRSEGVTALFVENISDPRLINQIASETGIASGARIYSDALSGPEGPAATYLAMMRYNAETLRWAMLGS